MPRRVTEWALRIANESYLPRIPPIAKDGQQITAFREIYTDFAVIDVHPSELSQTQQLPHVDPVPVFGLIYLNREERGGTLFFEKVGTLADASSESGYLTTSNSESSFADGSKQPSTAWSSTQGSFRIPAKSTATGLKMTGVSRAPD